MKNTRWREYSGGKLYAAILSKLPKDGRKMGLDELLAAGRWLCGWCKEFNAIGEEKCHSCHMVRLDYK